MWRIRPVDNMDMYMYVYVYGARGTRMRDLCGPPHTHDGWGRGDPQWITFGVRRFDGHVSPLLVYLHQYGQPHVAFQFKSPYRGAAPPILHR